MNRRVAPIPGIAAAALLLTGFLAGSACGGGQAGERPRTPTAQSATITATARSGEAGEGTIASATATSTSASPATPTAGVASSPAPGTSPSSNGTATPAHTATPTPSPLPTATPAPQPTLAPGEVLLIVSDGSGPGATVRAEVAETQAERAQGLMGRTALAEDAGMLFLFGGMAQGPFWMKNTYVPLDIAFLSPEGVVNEILEGEPESEDLLQPAAPYLYVLEVNQGWFARHGLGVGATVEIPERVTEAGGP